MSQIFKCDFCGTVTEDIAAVVFISLNGSVNLPEAVVIRHRQSAMADRMDCCRNCLLEKFSKPAPLVIDSTWSDA